ncbi:MAG: carboxypeptidase regulatory-like domain-containing protein [Bacteroidales bacterium]|nr:carboxypeptidase regulatory-like domain-containing protein [Bacteroidales bacterium]
MKKNAIYLTLLLTAFVLQAQRPITVIPQDNVKLSWGLKNLTVVDGHLYGCSNGVMVGSEMSGGMVYMLRPDTLAHYLGSDFSYVVRNPYDSLLYFSRMDASSGRYGLYVHVKDRGRKNRQVDANSWNMALYHPTFSSDGKMMVFSSQNKVGLGGFDLWCSFWNGKKWTKPLNMGNTINTPGNEVNPVFYGNYLIYSTNLQQNGAAYDFYAVYIKPGSTIDNILFGSYQTQRLPAPINSDSNDIELAVDPSLQFGYWVTNRGGKQELYCFQGRLDGVMLTGKVDDDKGRPVPNAEVAVLRNGRQVNSTISDHNGNFRLFVQPGEGYELTASCKNYFNYSTTTSAIRSDERFLVAEDRHDITLAYLPFDRIMVFDHIYQQGVDVELSNDGKRALSPLADFLRDNPQVHLKLSLLCEQTTDSLFNNMIIERRISDLQQYFLSVLPSIDQISFENGNSEMKNEEFGGGKNIIFAVLKKDNN